MESGIYALLLGEHTAVNGHYGEYVGLHFDQATRAYSIVRDPQKVSSSHNKKQNKKRNTQ